VGGSNGGRLGRKLNIKGKKRIREKNTKATLRKKNGNYVIQTSFFFLIDKRSS
jgi:hypothetical protein